LEQVDMVWKIVARAFYLFFDPQENSKAESTVKRMDNYQQLPNTLQVA